MKLTLILGLLLCALLMAHNANAFTLKCKVLESRYFLTGGYMVMRCIDKKSGVKFQSEVFEAGPGLRFAKYDDNWELINKKIRVICPFMRSKKLEKMKAGEKFVIAGPAADMGIFFGSRLGIEFGRPGVCFTLGYSTYEFGASFGMSFVHLYKQ